MLCSPSAGRPGNLLLELEDAADGRQGHSLAVQAHDVADLAGP